MKTRRFLTYFQRRRLRMNVSVLLSILLAIGIATLIGWLAGCTRTKIFVYPEPDDEGYVIIRPKQDKYKLPAVQYYFYNHDETIPYRMFESDMEGNFKGLLPVGHYRVLATNTTAQDVSFGEMDSYLTAVAYDNTLRGYLSAMRADAAVGAAFVYSLVMSNLEVLPGDTVSHSPAPVRLTRVLAVTFTLSGDLADQVTAISGNLQGVYPSIYLFTGFTPEEDVARSPDIWMDFTTTARPGHIWQAELYLFGLCDPRHGEVYHNRLKLMLVMEDGEYPFEVDLTRYLSDALEQTGGLLPSDLPLEISLQWEELEIESNITPWKRDGDTEIPVPIG